MIDKLLNCSTKQPFIFSCVLPILLNSIQVVKFLFYESKNQVYGVILNNSYAYPLLFIFQLQRFLL